MCSGWRWRGRWEGGGVLLLSWPTPRPISTTDLKRKQTRESQSGASMWYGLGELCTLFGVVLDKQYKVALLSCHIRVDRPTLRGRSCVRRFGKKLSNWTELYNADYTPRNATQCATNQTPLLYIHINHLEGLRTAKRTGQEWAFRDHNRPRCNLYMCVLSGRVRPFVSQMPVKLPTVQLPFKFIVVTFLGVLSDPCWLIGPTVLHLFIHII